MSEQTVTYRQSKLGQTTFTPSHRVGVMFTYNLDTTSEFDEIDPQFLADDATTNGTGLAGVIAQISGGNADKAIRNATGPGYGAENAKKILAAKKGVQEILVGAGIRSVNAEQQINVTQEGSLGFFDIVETISHNVASNTFTMEKMALRLRLLANSGVAPWGKDVITSPRLNAYIMDVKERQRGIDVGFLKVMGLHINTNRIASNVGTAMMENVTFRADRMVRVKRIPKALYQSLKQQFRTTMSGLEQLDPYVLDDGQD